MPVFRLGNELAFPDPNLAREDGLLAVGGDLSPQRLLIAYSLGIFPWYNPGDPILWWSPDPRFVLFPKELHVPKRLRRFMKKMVFSITFDTAFDQVIEQCAQVRIERGEGTWLVPEMIEAYKVLHSLGLAHSAETWMGGRLVGGLYGVALGRVFFGESMFSLEPDASKSAFVTLMRHLEEWGFALIDCQLHTAHLERFGARHISRQRFLSLLNRLIREPTSAPRIWAQSLGGKEERGN